MPLLDNKIGEKNFIALLGNVIPPTEMVEIDQRPAVDGTEVTRTGSKGKPFQMLSRVDTRNYADCHYLVDEYKTLIGDEPVDLVQGGVSMASRGFKVVVLNVEMFRALAISAAVGANLQLSQPRGLLECRWDLIAIADSQET